MIISLVALFLISFIYFVAFTRTRAKSKRVAEIATKLTEEKSREENLLASMADGVIAVDTERKIVIFNKAAEELTGLAPTEAIGLKSYDVFKLYDDKGQDVSNEKNDPFLEAWHLGKALLKEVFLKSGGKTTVLSLSVAPVRNFEGTITGGIAIFRDVTKKKEVDRMRNEFVSIASHEMRTPLFTVEGYLSLAASKAETSDPKSLEYVKKARAAVISMANLLNNLLVFSKIEEGVLQTKPEVFDIKEIIRASVNDLLPKAAAKEIKLEFKESLSAELGKKALSGAAMIKADREKIKEVLINLIDNGIKFTKQGSVVVTAGGDDQLVKVCVADTGPGISKPDQARLFQKFYRVDNSFTREVGGTGLGLYLSRQMVELFGGRIWVESEEGKGSTFCFTLPRANE